MRTRLGRAQRSSESYIEWRSRCLQNAGFEAALAERVAAEQAFDLHELLELVDRGCPPQLAVQILAPLEWEAPPS